MVRVWHPDRFIDDGRLHAKAMEKLRAINEAYLTLIEHLDSVSPSRAHSPFTPGPQRTTQFHPAARNNAACRKCDCGAFLT
ncbi:MAG TPA: hypothetical protein VIH59_29115, partial [Candidatus Tectomicrobia bacterium]